MKIEVYEWNGANLECRNYEVDSRCDRVLIEKGRSRQGVPSGQSEVWGFIETDGESKQVEGVLEVIEPHCAIVG